MLLWKLLNIDQLRNKPAMVAFIQVDPQVMSGDYWSVISHRLLMIDEIMMMPFWTRPTRWNGFLQRYYHM